MSNSNFDDFLEIFITISNLDILCFVKNNADLGPAWVSHSKKSHISPPPLI